MKLHYSSFLKNNHSEGDILFCIQKERYSLFVVFDALSSNTIPKKAAEIALSSLEQMTRQQIVLTPQLVISILNKELLKHELKGCLAGAYIANGTIEIFNCGDVRIYGAKEKKITQISLDHTYMAKLLAAGSITEEKTLTHEDKSVIEHCLGQTENPVIHTNRFSVTKYDQLLIASDGFYGPYLNRQLTYLYSNTLEKDFLQTIANYNLAEENCDDISAVLINLSI